MPIDRSALYRLPWSRSDCAGAWVEVTDACDLHCPGCYRHRISGHRAFEELEPEIGLLRRLNNCDRIAIAGGEPLLYPRIIDVVARIAEEGLKPVLLTNGERLTVELARELRRAGLAKYHFHVDSGMRRPGWEDKTEAEMNELRQHYADLVSEAGGVQCGYNITIFPATLQYLPDILGWARANLTKVQHLSLIAFRSIPITNDIAYTVGNTAVDVTRLQHTTAALEMLDVTVDAMYETIRTWDPSFAPSAYLPGTSAPDTHKFLVAVQVGSRHGLHGYLGARAVECVQVGHHLVTGRYCAFLRNPRVGMKLLLMGLVDPGVRRIAGNVWRMLLRRPVRALAPLYTQSVSLQQPNEIVDGRVNLCDGCLNMMLYGGQLIPSCRLDEYRLFGGPLEPARVTAMRPGTSPSGTVRAPSLVAAQMRTGGSPSRSTRC
jgi:uncharacterized Fe-S cluster-containing radical SAM superfamily protein